MTRKRWSELSGRQQAAIVATVVVQETLATAALWPSVSATPVTRPQPRSAIRRVRADQGDIQSLDRCPRLRCTTAQGWQA
jgi:hypothetical protein